jgi:hypothetical protein
MSTSRWFALAASALGIVAPTIAPTIARAQSAKQQAAIAALIPVQEGATIDRDTVTIGDVMRVTVRIRAPRGATINFPAAADSLGPVQSLEPPRVTNGADSASAADRTAIYRMAAWDVGALAVKLGDVLVQTDDGERRIALTLPGVFVKSVLPADSAQRVPKPARPLLAVPSPTPWWWWLVAALAVIAIGLGFWWWRRRQRLDASATGDPLADAETAFDRIERLGLVAAGEPGRHVILMTDVLRRYLAARIDDVTLAQTSGELLHAVRGTPTVAHDRLERLLASVDRVKFAAAPIGGEAARAAGTEARALVGDEHQRAAALAAAAVARAEAARAQRAAA